MAEIENIEGTILPSIEETLTSLGDRMSAAEQQFIGVNEKFIAIDKRISQYHPE